MKDGSTKVVGSAVVKDVNFANGASRNAAMAQGVNAIGGAMKAMDIGAQKQLGTNTADPTGGNVKGTASPTAGTLDKMLETAEGVGKAAVGSLKRGGIASLGLVPMLIATDEEMDALSAPVIAANIAKNEEKQATLLSQIRGRTDSDGYVVSYKAPTPEQLKF